jgi:hypothetical protein
MVTQGIKLMLHKISVIFFIVFTNLSFAQDRFVSIVEGWMAFKVFENNNGYYSFGLKSLSSSEPLRFVHQFDELSLMGSVNSQWSFYIDTTYATGNFNPRAIALHSNRASYYSASFIRTNGDYLYTGYLFKYKPDFSDTLAAFKIDIADSEQLRIFKEIEPNKIILGESHQLGASDPKARSGLIEIDTLGNIFWQKEYACSGDCNMNPVQITPLPDGGYFYTNEEIHMAFGLGGDLDNIKSTLIRTDASGNLLWRKYFGDANFDNERPFIVPTDDGNYLMFWCKTKTAGWDDKLVAEDATINVAKIDIDGNILWQKNYLEDLNQPHYLISDIKVLSDGNITITGKIGDFLGLVFIMKIDQNGELIWYRDYTMPNNNVFYQGFYSVNGLTTTFDGGYVIATEYISEAGDMFSEYTQTGAVIKLDGYGCLEENCHLVSTDNLQLNQGLDIYPNPTDGVIEIVSDEVFEKVEIMDVTGKLIFSKKLKAKTDKIDLTSFENGIYFINAYYVNGKLRHQKIIKR